LSEVETRLIGIVFIGNHLRQVDLAKIIGASSGVVSEIVSGKRAISKAQAKVLGQRFKISPSLFI